VQKYVERVLDVPDRILLKRMTEKTDKLQSEEEEEEEVKKLYQLNHQGILSFNNEGGDLVRN